MSPLGDADLLTPWLVEWTDHDDSTGPHPPVRETRATACARPAWTGCLHALGVVLADVGPVCGERFGCEIRYAAETDPLSDMAEWIVTTRAAPCRCPHRLRGLPERGMSRRSDADIIPGGH